MKSKCIRNASVVYLSPPLSRRCFSQGEGPGVGSLGATSHELSGIGIAQGNHATVSTWYGRNQHGGRYAGMIERGSTSSESVKPS